MYTLRLPLFLAFGLALLPSTANPAVTDGDTCPTYSQYTTLISGFAAGYPATCSLQEVGHRGEDVYRSSESSARMVSASISSRIRRIRFNPLRMVRLPDPSSGWNTMVAWLRCMR